MKNVVNLKSIHSQNAVYILVNGPWPDGLYASTLILGRVRPSLPLS